MFKTLFKFTFIICISLGLQGFCADSFNDELTECQDSVDRVSFQTPENSPASSATNSTRDHQSTSEKTHHCKCALSCQSMVVFTHEDQSFAYFIELKMPDFFESYQNYHQIYFTVEKPPKV